MKKIILLSSVVFLFLSCNTNSEKEIISSFIMINDNIENTTYHLEIKKQKLHETLINKTINCKSKSYYLNRFLIVKDQSSKIISEIFEVKRGLIGFVEFDDEKLDSTKFKWMVSDQFVMINVGDFPLTNINNLLDYKKSTNYLFKQGGNSIASSLKNKINEYKEKVLYLITDSTTSVDIGGILNTENRWNQEVRMIMNWEYNTFNKTVLAADIIILNNLIKEVLIFENEIENSILVAIENE